MPGVSLRMPNQALLLILIDPFDADARGILECSRDLPLMEPLPPPAPLPGAPPHPLDRSLSRRVVVQSSQRERTTRPAPGLVSLVSACMVAASVGVTQHLSACPVCLGVSPAPSWRWNSRQTS